MIRLAASSPLARPLARWSGEVHPGDAVFRGITGTFAAISALPLAAIGAYLFVAARPAFHTLGPALPFGTEWAPNAGHFGALPLLLGTLVTSAIALVIAVPIALGVALFLAELARPWQRRVVGPLVELLASVPSVVFGLFGAFALAPRLEHALHVAPLRLSWASAGLVIAMMIVPTIASVSRDVLEQVPEALREAALALGATRWEAVRHVVLPHARSGLVGAIVLGLGRALGEAIAVAIIVDLGRSELEGAATAASLLVHARPGDHDLHASALAAIALLLFATTCAVNLAARVLVRRVARSPSELFT